DLRLAGAVHTRDDAVLVLVGEFHRLIPVPTKRVPFDMALVAEHDRRDLVARWEAPDVRELRLVARVRGRDVELRLGKVEDLPTEHYLPALVLRLAQIVELRQRQA